MSDNKHTHELDDIPGLKILFSSRAPVDHQHKASEIVEALRELGVYPVKKDTESNIERILKDLSGKADKSLVEQVKVLVFKKADAQHRHSYNEVQGLSEALENKANRSELSSKADKAEVQNLTLTLKNKIERSALDPINGELRLKADKKDLETLAPVKHKHVISDIEDLEKTLKALSSLNPDKVLAAVNEKAPRVHRHSFKDMSDFPSLVEALEKARYPTFRVGIMKDKKLIISFDTTNGYYTPSLRIQTFYDRKDSVFVQLSENKFIDGQMEYSVDLSHLPVNTLLRFQVRVIDVNNPKMKIDSEYLESRF